MKLIQAYSLKNTHHFLSDSYLFVAKSTANNPTHCVKKNPLKKQKKQDC